MLTISKVENEFNCKVYVKHYRTVNNRGGATIVTVKEPIPRLTWCSIGSIKTVDYLVADGVALCDSKDYYNKKLGVRIALGRALKQLKLPTK